MYREGEIKQKGREGNVLRFALDAARNHLKKERGEKTHTHTLYRKGEKEGEGEGDPKQRRGHATGRDCI